jgi:hypothetical protein
MNSHSSVTCGTATQPPPAGPNLACTQVQRPPINCTQNAAADTEDAVADTARTAAPVYCTRVPLYNSSTGRRRYGRRVLQQRMHSPSQAAHPVGAEARRLPYDDRRLHRLAHRIPETGCGMPLLQQAALCGLHCTICMQLCLNASDEGINRAKYGFKGTVSV